MSVLFIGGSAKGASKNPCARCFKNAYCKISGDIIQQNINKLQKQQGLEKASDLEKATGFGKSKKLIMIVGDVETPVNCIKGDVFNSPGANILKELLTKHNLDKHYLYYTIAYKCALNRKLTSTQLKNAAYNCRGYLINEINLTKPDVIILCGSLSVQVLLDQTADNKSIKISELYGTRITRDKERYAHIYNGIDDSINPAIFPVINPGLLIHKVSEYKVLDMQIGVVANHIAETDRETTEASQNTTNTGTSVVGLVSEAAYSAEVVYEVLDENGVRKVYNEMMELHNCGELGPVAFDIETTSLDYREAEVLVVGFSYADGKSYVLPRELNRYIKLFVQDMPISCIWHNGKYDKKVLGRRRLGVAHIDEDTIYMHYALDETSPHDLGYLTKMFLFADEYKYKMNQNWQSVTLDTYDQYFEALCERVAVDAEHTRRLFFRLAEELAKPENEDLLRLYKNMLIPAANMLVRVEENGCLIDAQYLDGLKTKYEQYIDKIKEDIDKISDNLWDAEAYKNKSGAKTAPEKFNPASPKQMSWLVYDRLKLKPRIRKGRSTDKSVLESIENPPEIIRRVLELRGVLKEYSTYVVGLLDARDTDYRVHTTFTLHVTATGRLSSKEPNIQNQPSARGVGNIRRAFIAPPGYILGEIDYSGAELRWLAFLSGDETLTAIFNEGRNLHHETATSLFGAHYDKPQKMIAKALNFGIAYGREAKSIADAFNISKAQAQEYINNWLDAYPQARDYLRRCGLMVSEGAELKTLWGRRRRFGMITSETLHTLINEAKNFAIQSSSSDTLLYCCLLHEKQLADMGVRIINLVHDSVLVEIPARADIIKDFGEKMNAWMVEIPKKLFNCQVPFKTDFEIGINWEDLGGTEFDYNCNVYTDKPVKVTQKDDSIIEYDFDDWYHSITA